MGTNHKDLELLIRLAEQGHIKPNSRIVEIGAQQLSNSFLGSVDAIRKLEALLNSSRTYKLPEKPQSRFTPEGVELLSPDAPMARDFWISLGFEYSAVDVDGSPGSIPLDLNYDQAPQALRGKFDIVTNFGTTEHICNQLNAFQVVHDLAAPGAIMIHHLPAGGAINHGIFNYNPKFFWHLARSNDYKWHCMDFYGGDVKYKLPNNLLDYIRERDAAAFRTMERRELSDYAILVALEKALDMPFIPPLDVNTGIRTTDAALKKRYWTVFQPELLVALRSGKDVSELIASAPESRAGRDAAAATRLEDLPALPKTAKGPSRWALIEGLWARPIEGPGGAEGQPVLHLSAERRESRHAITVDFTDLPPGSGYRVAAWVKATAPMSVMLEARDSVDAATGQPPHYGMAQFDLAARSTITSRGGFLGQGIEPAPHGWLKVWADLESKDGKLFVLLGLLERPRNLHLFEGRDQELILGGIEYQRLQ